MSLDATATASVKPTLPPPATHKSRWNWRRDVNYFFVALTEILWLAPLVELIGSNTSAKVYPQNLGSIFILVVFNVVVALSLRRFLIFKRKTSDQQFPFFLLGFAISFFLTLLFLPLLTQTGTHLDSNFGTDFGFKNQTLPPAFIYFLVVGLLWYRGLQIGKSTLTHVAVSVQMRLGILMYLFICIVGNPTTQDHLLTMLPIFFASGLMATALARSATLHIEEGERSRFGLSWMGFILTAVIVITSIAFVAALILAGIDRDKALDVLRFIGVGIVTVLFIIVSPILWLLNTIFTFLQGLNPSTPPNGTEEGGKIDPQTAKDVDRLEYGDALNAVLSFASHSAFYITIVVLATIFIFFWLTFFFTRENINFDKEESEDIDERELIGGIRKAVGNQLKKLGDMFNMVRQFGFGSDLMGVLTIRWAYSRMEREAKKRGYARDKSQTPYEYRQMVAKAFPGGEQSIKVITDAYVAIRYGDLPENSDRLDHVRQALDQLMAIEAPP